MDFWTATLFEIGDGHVITVSQLVYVLAFGIAGLLLSRFLAHLVLRRLSKTTLDANAVNVIQRTVFYLLLVTVVLTALALLHIPLTALAFLSGAVAIGVGFGAQAIINNLISGWILISTRPVRIGDFVDVDGSFGVIEDIGNRATKIRRVDGVHMLVPNSIMLERTVVNWTLVDHNIRTTLRVGVAYGSPVRKVQECLYQVIAEHQSILEEPKPIVVFEDFGDSALIFDLYFWCEVGGERELRLVRSDLRFRIDEVFAENGIVIAFPQRDVHIDAAAPLRVLVEKEARR